jgi:asparagine synthase (glutamine-hydrolysing)
MCGIFGIINRNGLADGDRDLVRRLAAALVHRGPDGEGFAESGPVAVGMRRLAIIDLEGGWQPLWNEDESIAMVANGEVYNFVELRRDLEARGHRFRTGSDCETIIHLYEEHGSECVKHLRGMFAFALHDRRNGKVLIARDRIGEKPLYITGNGDRIVFASEMRGLVGAGAVPFEIDPAAVNLYLHYGFVPEPWAAVKGVRKLGAGHLLEISLEPWSVRERRWWAMEDAPPIDADPASTVRDMLEEVRRSRGRGPVGRRGFEPGGHDGQAQAR